MLALRWCFQADVVVMIYWSHYPSKKQLSELSRILEFRKLHFQTLLFESVQILVVDHKINEALNYGNCIIRVRDKGLWSRSSPPPLQKKKKIYFAMKTFEQFHLSDIWWNTAQKCFPLKTSSVNVTKSTGNWGFGHIYWRNP